MSKKDRKLEGMVENALYLVFIKTVKTKCTPLRRHYVFELLENALYFMKTPCDFITFMKHVVFAWDTLCWQLA